MYVCMYVCISISASMWSIAERASARVRSWLCEGWGSVLGSLAVGVIRVLRLVLFVQGPDMPWLSPWFCVLFMAATSAPGVFQRPTRWEISLCVGCCKSYLWSGCHNASSCNYCSGPNARIVGRELQHLKSYTRDGACFGLPRKGECCVSCPGLILIFAGQCYVLAAFAATLHWMRWTSSKQLPRMWLHVRRSLRGAYRLHCESWHQAGSFLEQVVGIIFVLLLVLMSVAGGLVYVPGILASQYSRCFVRTWRGVRMLMQHPVIASRGRPHEAAGSQVNRRRRPPWSLIALALALPPDTHHVPFPVLAQCRVSSPFSTELLLQHAHSAVDFA